MKRCIFCLVLAVAFNGCAQESNIHSDRKINENRELLSKANSTKSWFHAKKTKPLWAKLAEEDGTLATLETNDEEPETYSKGDYICRGEVGDVWPQSAKSLKKKYDETDDFTEFDGKEWQKFTPKKDNAGVMAIQIHDVFEVQASWGRLQGKVGDYLLKNYSDKNADYPDDVWIVDQKIFDSSYQRVDKEN